MKYIIKGKGGQGVLFLSKIIAHSLMLSDIKDFNFLKEFDEGQRGGDIKVTFKLPFDLPDKELIIKEHNLIELKKVVRDLDLKNIEESIKIVKPSAFKKNLEIWLQK